MFETPHFWQAQLLLKTMRLRYDQTSSYNVDEGWFSALQGSRLLVESSFSQDNIFSMPVFLNAAYVENCFAKMLCKNAESSYRAIS